jgi:hypothetical protein
MVGSVKAGNPEYLTLINGDLISTNTCNYHTLSHSIHYIATLMTRTGNLLGVLNALHVFVTRATGAAISSASLDTTATTIPTLSISTETARASVIPLASSLPSQLPLPPTQEWCPSQIFCAEHVCHTLF